MFLPRPPAAAADVVHVCDRSNPATLKGGDRGNVWWRPALERFEGEHGVRFKDGELEEVLMLFGPRVCAF